MRIAKRKISLIEEASLTKESLKESFVERLRCISVGELNYLLHLDNVLFSVDSI